MRFGLIQIALGVALVAMGPLFGGIHWALAWPGFSVLVVGLAYLAGRAAVFGKSPLTGRLSSLHVAVLFPYYLVAWTLWQLKSRLGAEPPHAEVAPGIVVGRRPIDEGELPEGVTVIVDLTSEFSRSATTASVERYLSLPTLDTAAPSPAALRVLVDQLEHEEGPIFFHCAMGHGRSATAAAALMIRRGLAEDVEGAVAAMQRARPSIRLHHPQRQAVRTLTNDAAEDRPDRAPRPA